MHDAFLFKNVNQQTALYESTRTDLAVLPAAASDSLVMITFRARTPNAMHKYSNQLHSVQSASQIPDTHAIAGLAVPPWCSYL